MNKITVSFPGLGIEDFVLNKVAFGFSLFGKPIEVRWYGIVITLGIILAFLYAWYRSKKEKISLDDLLDITIFTVVFGVLGARLYYVLTTLGHGYYESIVDVIAIWNGGLAIYGGIIAGFFTILTVCKIKKIKPLKALDMAAPAVMIGQLLGRWGNFFNGEAYGYIVPETSPLYFLRMGLIPNIQSSTRMYYFHPTFLYESVWNLVGFVIINILYRKKKFDGQILYSYVAWYGFGRMLIEQLRTDSLYVGPFRISQVVGFCCFVAGAILLVYNYLKLRKARLAEGAYDAAYPQFKTETGEKTAKAKIKSEEKETVPTGDKNEKEDKEDKE